MSMKMTPLEIQTLMTVLPGSATMTRVDFRERENSVTFQFETRRSTYYLQLFDKEGCLGERRHFCISRESRKYDKEGFPLMLIATGSTAKDAVDNWVDRKFMI